MGKPIIISHFQQLFLCLPGRVPTANDDLWIHQVPPWPPWPPCAKVRTSSTETWRAKLGTGGRLRVLKLVVEIVPGMFCNLHIYTDLTLFSKWTWNSMCLCEWWPFCCDGSVSGGWWNTKRLRKTKTCRVWSWIFPDQSPHRLERHRSKLARHVWQLHTPWRLSYLHSHDFLWYFNRTATVNQLATPFGYYLFHIAMENHHYS